MRVYAHLREAVVDGGEKDDGEGHDCGPDGAGDEERCEAGLIAAQDCFCDEEQEAERVPKRHSCAESSGDEANGSDLSVVVELPNDRVEKDGNCELGADHESDAENCRDIEKSHRSPLLSLRRGRGGERFRKRRRGDQRAPVMV